MSFLLAAEIGGGAAATVFNWIAPGVLVVLTVKHAERRWEDDFDPDKAMGGVRGLLGAFDIGTGFDDQGKPTPA